MKLAKRSMLLALICSAWTAALHAAPADVPLIKVPELPAVPMMVDGVIDQAEWAGALDIPLTNDTRLRLKQSAGHFYLAVDNAGPVPLPVDIHLIPAALQHIQLHSSAQLAERRITRSDPNPAWQWGNNKDWIASEAKIDPAKQALPEHSQRLYAADGTEFQIKLNRFAGTAWRVRLTVADHNGNPSLVYPANSINEDFQSWAIWQFTPPSLPATTVNFASADGLTITADEYPHANPDAPILLLCHRAGWSRGEYQPLAAWLQSQGFSLFAIDQRSGAEVNGVINQTFVRAAEAKLKTDYLSAKQDIEAALRYLQQRYPTRRIVLMGSSYSSALALRIAGENHFNLAGVIAFAPGEYFAQSDYIAETASDITIPTFITSAKSEVDQWAAIANNINQRQLTRFVPDTEGLHGAQALWPSTPEYKQYREALQKFFLLSKDNLQNKR